MGLLADTIASNRRILQDVQLHVKNIEYGKNIDEDLKKGKEEHKENKQPE